MIINVGTCSFYIGKRPSNNSNIRINIFLVKRKDLMMSMKYYVASSDIPYISWGLEKAIVWKEGALPLKYLVRISAFLFYNTKVNFVSFILFFK